MITAIYQITWFAPHYHHVHIMKDGIYTGIGAFCESRQAMIEFCKEHNVTKIEHR